MTARSQYAEVLAALLAEHVMRGEPECLSPSMVWIWRCVCSPEYARPASVRSVALTSHRAHVADALAAALPSAALPDPEQAVREALDPIYAEVKAERARAHAKHGGTSMESCAPDDYRRLAILCEEVGEVAREFNEGHHRGTGPDLGRLRKELIQTAAMAAAWADVIPAEARP